MTDSWLLDELTHTGPEHLDAEYVEPMLAAAGLEVVDAEFARPTYGRYLCRGPAEGAIR